MKNILKVIKNKSAVVGTLILCLPTKVLAMDEYMRTSPMYGIQEPKTEINSVWSICKFLIVPIALLVGIIIYIKKSKSSKRRKIITVLIVLTIVTLLYLGMNYLVKEVL